VLFSVTGFGQKTGEEWKCSKTKKETGINAVSGEKVYEVSVLLLSTCRIE